jgi:hypothetical protein
MIPEELGKGLDATKEVAIAAGKAFDAVKGFGGFLGKLFGPPMSEASGYIGDQIAFWRRMNGLKFEQKFQRRCEQLGFSPDSLRPPPLSLTYKVLGAASLEETDEVQELWAELLAKSIDPATEFIASKMHISLLKEFNPADAALLKALSKIEPIVETVLPQSFNGWDNDKQLENQLFDEISARNCAVNTVLNGSWDAFAKQTKDASIENLHRLNCIAQIQTRRRIGKGLMMGPVKPPWFFADSDGTVRKTHSPDQTRPDNLANFFEIHAFADDKIEMALFNEAPHEAYLGCLSGSKAIAIYGTTECTLRLTSIGRSIILATTP